MEKKFKNGDTVGLSTKGRLGITVLFNKIETGNYVSADGNNLCPQCNLPYKQHPSLNYIFALLCDYKVVKINDIEGQ